MAIIKHEFPILEYDTAQVSFAQPNKAGNAAVPKHCLMAFFGEVLEDYVAGNNGCIINYYTSETRRYPIYKINYKGINVGLIQAAVGSASVASMSEVLIACGAEKLFACGSCGVLSDIPAGDIIVPTSALRGEGASYSYLPPSREVELDRDIVEIIKSSLDECGISYIEGKTWTTDAFYRETPDMITYRKAEGCIVVEMECATLAAVSKFRGVKFGQLLYSGDTLSDFDNYDERDWRSNLGAREKLFSLSLNALIRM